MLIQHVLILGDFIYAKEFLKTKCEVEIYYGVDKVMTKFAKIFKNNTDKLFPNDLRSCFKTLEEKIVKLDENESDLQYFIERNFDSLSAFNNYDMMLYFYALNSM